MSYEKITIYSPLTLDEGILNLVDYGFDTLFYLKSEERGFHPKRVRKISSFENETLLKFIFKVREPLLKEKILERIRKKNPSIWMITGIEKQRIFHNKLGMQKIISKKIICLYISGFTFLPGIAYNKHHKPFNLN